MQIVKECAESVSSFVFGATGVAIAAVAPAIAGVATGAVPALVGAGTLIGIATAACAKHGPESQATLNRIRQRLERDWRLEKTLDRVSDEQLTRASEELHWYLQRCMLDRQELAASAIDSRRFPEAATDLVLSKLGKRYAGFLPDGEHDIANAVARDFAKAVIRTAFQEAIENEGWFQQLAPYVAFELARAMGEVLENQREISNKLEELTAIAKKQLELAKNQEQRAIAKLEQWSERQIEPHSARPYAAPRAAISSNGWYDLWELLKSLPVEVDQKMRAAFSLCSTDTTLHDVHVLRALSRVNPVFARHPYADRLFEELNNDRFLPGETHYQNTGESLAGKVVPSLAGSLRQAAQFGVLSTNSFLAGWARNALIDSGSPSRRSHLIDLLIGEHANSHSGGISEIPELEQFMNDLVNGGAAADDIDYILAVEADDRLVFRPATVLRDAVQQNSSGLLLPMRAMLTHLEDSFCGIDQSQIRELEEMINSPISSSEDLHAFFERNPHFLRRGDYREVFAQPYLHRKDAGPLVPSFILTDRELGRATVVELKLPDAQLIRRDAEGQRFASAVLEARSQLLRHRDWFRDAENRRSLARFLGMEIYEPRLAVVIGRSGEFQDAVDRQRLSADNPDIEVLTYDDLVTQARRRQYWIRG